MSERRPKTIVLSEEMSAEVERLLEYGRARGKVARETRVGGRGAEPVRTIHPDKPEITQLLREELVSALEDEIVPAGPTTARRGIFDWELEREVAKKALIGLKLQTLKSLAEGLRLDKRGNIEDLADRIARTYRYDEHEIAQLVLDHEDEPEPERGHNDRIFPLQEELDIEHAVERLCWVTGRYIRVGVARWFVFERVDAAAGRLTLHGALRSYSVSVNAEEALPGPEDTSLADTPLADEAAPESDNTAERASATLGSSPSESEVRVVVVTGSSSVRIHSRNISAARSAARALESVAGAKFLGHLPIARRAFEGPAGTFSERTIFMLDLLYNRLEDVHATGPNLTIARFEMDRSDADTSVEGSRPAVREVRFEGDHLLDSLAASRLIALEGRALLDLSLRVSFGGSGDDPAPRYPVRVSLERDHVLVLTGFGREAPESSLALQRHLVRTIERALSEGVKDVSRLETLGRSLDRFARANKEAEKPVMLAEPDADDVEE